MRRAMQRDLEHLQTDVSSAGSAMPKGARRTTGRSAPPRRTPGTH
jgi:hypothetical protein